MNNQISDIIVIWESVSERTRVYLLRDLPPKTTRQITNVHGKFINTIGTDDNQILTVYNTFLKGKAPLVDSEDINDPVSIYAPNSAKNTVKIVLTGELL